MNLGIAYYNRDLYIGHVSDLDWPVTTDSSDKAFLKAAGNEFEIDYTWPHNWLWKWRPKDFTKANIWLRNSVIPLTKRSRYERLFNLLEKHPSWWVLVDFGSKEEAHT